MSKLRRDYLMKLSELAQELGYKDATGYLTGKKLFSIPDLGHIFRKAAKPKAENGCSLRGVYGIQTQPIKKISPINPVVYICEATDEAEADEIHRRVWNQNIVPFLIVLTRSNIRLYSGQDYAASRSSTGRRGVLNKGINLHEIAEQLEALHSYEIDSGKIWQKLKKTETDKKVHSRLLKNLRELEEGLRNKKLSRDLSHSLIGKYVYLKYLRDREILSDRKLAKWGIRPEQVFSRHAEKEAFKCVIQELDHELNGSVFPLDPDSIKLEHLQWTAGIFSGDETGGQLHLDFKAYDFSFIPIETLSTIYQDFLHAPDEDTGESRGEKSGAYYTPVRLANFMIEEMYEHLAFKEGMKILDPSCGSGVFLVQIYRRLIEKKVSDVKTLTPVILRDLLTNHIFGVERDEDACRIAELSLLLTLLDYVNPPDLESTRFKLPDLHNRNIYHSDFFHPDLPIANEKFHWIIGNPPWIELKTGKNREMDQPLWDWFKANKNEYPTGGHQAAEAFAHEVTKYILENGVVGLLLPAMTLFKNESKEFRRTLFTRNRLLSVANLSNARRELFEKAIAPPALLFYSPKNRQEDDGLTERSRFQIWSPIVASQSFLKKMPWQIAINAEELKELDQSQIENGESLRWKAALWGSHYDIRLLDSLTFGFETLSEFCEKNELMISQGLELRKATADEKIEKIPEVIGKYRVNFEKLRNSGRIFSFPDESLSIVKSEEAYCRKGRGKLPMAVSRPPHIIIDASRRFSVYSDIFLIMPPRHIGLSGDKSKKNILKVLNLWINSDVVFYFDFYSSTEQGIRSTRSTLATLKSLPIPINKLQDTDISQLANLHDKIVQADLEERQNRNGDNPSLFQNSNNTGLSLSNLLREMNQKFYDLLDLKEWQRSLIEDLVHVKIKAADNAVPEELIALPPETDIVNYCEALKSTLDDYLNSAGILKYHKISVIHDSDSGMIHISLLDDARQAKKITVEKATKDTQGTFARMRTIIRKEYSQWVYIDRNLKIYEGENIYLFKPLKRLSWLRSKALEDASSLLSQIISEDHQK